MAPSKKTIPTIACALALASSTEAFMAPGAARSQRGTGTIMSMQSHKASAAAFLAGVITLGGVLDVAPPANAAIFDQSAPALQLNVGFGQPGALDDSSNNNAASGKENGSKYDIQQQGKFAEQNSAGAVDYGSAKGTDFGKTAGGKAGVATETKATDGDFLADAKRDTQEGTKIAAKNTKDAANVDFGKDVRTSGAGTLGDGIEAAKKAVTGGASSSSAKWAGVVDAKDSAVAKANAAQSKQWTTGPANTAKVPEKSLNNGFTNAFRVKPAGAAEIEDIGRAGQNIKDQAKSAVSDVADATSDLRNPNVNAALTGKAGGELGQAQRDPQGKAQKDLKTAKNAVPNSWGGGANKVKGEVRQAANNPQQKVNKDVNRAKGAVENALPNSVADAASNAADSVKNSVSDALNVEKGSPASTLLSLQEPEGGIALSTDPAKAAQISGQKTINKVQNDIETARANPPFQENSAGSAANSVKGKVNKDLRNARKTWEYGQQSARKAARQFERSGKEFSLANIGGQAKKAVNNPQGKVNADVRKAQQAASNAQRAVEKKVSSDIKTAQKATPDAPKVGGLFGTNPKQQADITGKKTAQKVTADINAVKGGLLN